MAAVDVASDWEINGEGITYNGGAAAFVAVTFLCSNLGKTLIYSKIPFPANLITAAFFILLFVLINYAVVIRLLKSKGRMSNWTATLEGGVWKDLSVIFMLVITLVLSEFVHPEYGASCFLILFSTMFYVTSLIKILKPPSCLGITDIFIALSGGFLSHLGKVEFKNVQHRKQVEHVIYMIMICVSVIGFQCHRNHYEGAMSTGFEDPNTLWGVWLNYLWEPILKMLIYCLKFIWNMIVKRIWNLAIEAFYMERDDLIIVGYLILCVVIVAVFTVGILMLIFWVVNGFSF